MYALIGKHLRSINKWLKKAHAKNNFPKGKIFSSYFTVPSNRTTEDSLAMNLITSSASILGECQMCPCIHTLHCINNHSNIETPSSFTSIPFITSQMHKHFLFVMKKYPANNLIMVQQCLGILELYSLICKCTFSKNKSSSEQTK